VDNPDCQVDCVTGATLTSNGVDAMLKTCLVDACPIAFELFEDLMTQPQAVADSTATEPKVMEE